MIYQLFVEISEENLKIQISKIKNQIEKENQIEKYKKCLPQMKFILQNNFS